MTKQNIGALQAAASAAGFATLAILIKLAYQAGANVITILAARFLIAVLFLGLVATMRGISLSVKKKTRGQLCLLGVLGYGGMSLLFASSLQYLPASLAAMLLYTYPALVTIISFLLGTERFSLPKGLALTVCFIGLSLVLGVSFSGTHPVGIMLALGSAIIYSCYIVIGNQLLKEVDVLVTTIYVCASAATIFIAGGIATGNINLALPLQGWLALLGIAIFPTIIGILGFFAGMAHIGAANASIISTVEPVITVILAALLLNESVTLLQATGGALVLSGIIILQLWAKDSVKKAGRNTTPC